MKYNSGLSPNAALFLTAHNLNPFSAVDKLPISIARKAYEFFAFTQGGVPPKLFNIENRLLSFKSVEHSIPIRIYKVSDQPAPLLIYLHGGGWSLGSLNTHDALCRMLSSTANCTILSIDYRLAPEHPYPSELDDICLIYNWCHKNAPELNVIPHKIALGGDSSGGNLAAAFTTICVEENLPLPNFQVLLYPTLDLNLHHPSMTDFGTGYFLTKNEMKYYRNNYAANLDVTDWHISPLRYPLFYKLPPSNYLNCRI